MAKSGESPPHGTTVYVVDDDDAMRCALSALLSAVGYKTAFFGRPSEFLARFKLDSPGCLVLDIRMPEMSGLELQQQLNRVGAILPVIFITGHGDVPMAVQAMKEGAFQFIEKPFRDQELLDHINHALQLDAENRKDLARRAVIQERQETLTPRERQVMELVVEGQANKVMAIDLGLSERTVEIHRAKVMEKMGARSVAHLVKMHLPLQPNPRLPADDAITELLLAHYVGRMPGGRRSARPAKGFHGPNFLRLERNKGGGFFEPACARES